MKIGPTDPQISPKVNNDPAFTAFIHQQLHSLNGYLPEKGVLSVQVHPVELETPKRTVEIIYKFSDAAINAKGTGGDIYSATICARQQLQEQLGELLNLNDGAGKILQ